jgi:hypothetical protein
MLERERLLNQSQQKPKRQPARKIRRPNAVFGATLGFDEPTYDYSWEYHDPNPPPNPTDQFVADPTNGDPICEVSNGGFGPSQSGAGVMFWYVPDKTGVLNVLISPNVQESVYAGAWHDQGNASTYLSLGIQRW